MVPYRSSPLRFDLCADGVLQRFLTGTPLGWQRDLAAYAFRLRAPQGDVLCVPIHSISGALRPATENDFALAQAASAKLDAMNGKSWRLVARRTLFARIVDFLGFGAEPEEDEGITRHHIRARLRWPHGLIGQQIGWSRGGRVLVLRFPHGTDMAVWRDEVAPQ